MLKFYYLYCLLGYPFLNYQHHLNLFHYKNSESISTITNSNYKIEDYYNYFYLIHIIF